MSKKNFRTSEPGQVAMPTAVRETAPDGLATGSASGTMTSQGDHHVETLDDRAPAAIPASPAPGPVPSPPVYIAPSLRALAVPMLMLRPMAGNPRRHANRDVAAIAESLRRFGQTKPVVVHRQTGQIIAGNGTYAAARRLGWTFVAVSYVECSEAEARAYAIADNRTAELSQWDITALAQDARTLDLSPWFTEPEMADLLSALGSDAPADFAPAPDAPQGQLDALGSETTCPACGHRFAAGGR